MRKLVAWVAVGVGVWGGLDAIGVQARAAMTPALTALIEAERAFARTAGEKGTRDAFLEYLADESLLFTPGPTPGKMFYRNRPALPTRLSWAPEFADISAAGDLGYTSGPYEIRKALATDTPSGYGHFNSLWRLQKDGQWRVEVDLGIPHDKGGVAVADVKTVDTPTDNAAAPAESKPLLDWQNELLDVDKAMAKRAAAGSVVKAFEEYAADSIRLYRSDHLPAIGKAAALKLVESSGTGQWQPTLARMAKSGDLGYSSGAIRMPAAAAPAGAPPPRPPAPGASPAAPPAAPAGPPTAAMAANTAANSAPAPLSAPQAAPQSPVLPTPGTAPMRPSTGALPPAPSAPHFYIRIWRRDKAGAWKIVLDVAP
jgi:ketosteroid isomerase-like protein